MAGISKSFLLFTPIYDKLIYFDSCMKILLKLANKYKILYGVKVDNVIEKLNSTTTDEIKNLILSNWNIFVKKLGDNVFYLEIDESSCKIDMNTKKLYIACESINIENDTLELDILTFKKRNLPEKVVRTSQIETFILWGDGSECVWNVR